MTRASQRMTTERPANDLEIRRKVDDMISYAYVAVRQFPKAERHVLSAEIRKTCWQLLRLVIVCNKRYHKKTTMQDLDAELEVLRHQVRKAMELGFLPMKKYTHWAMLNDEIGRMVGGWIKSQRSKGDGR